MPMGKSLREGFSVVKHFAVAAIAALVSACSTNPVTGRDQIVSHPAVQAYDDLGFSIQTGAEGMANGQYCDQNCLDRQKAFAEQVARLGAELESAAREMSPEVFTRIKEFQVKVYSEWGTGTGSSASGRIAVGAGLAQFGPADDVTGFMLAREMAHVIARHGEEDSLARIVVSVVSTILPVYNLVAKFFASTVGSGAITSSWAGKQQREA